MEIFARDIKTGDKINMIFDGWQTVKKVEQFKIFIRVIFENEKQHDFFYDQKIWRV